MNATQTIASIKTDLSAIAEKLAELDAKILEFGMTQYMPVVKETPIFGFACNPTPRKRDYGILKTLIDNHTYDITAVDHNGYTELMRLYRFNWKLGDRLLNKLMQENLPASYWNYRSNTGERFTAAASHAYYNTLVGVASFNLNTLKKVLSIPGIDATETFMVYVHSLATDRYFTMHVSVIADIIEIILDSDAVLTVSPSESDEVIKMLCQVNPEYGIQPSVIRLISKVVNRFRKP